MNIQDTIAAISTPRGKGGVAMIRVSGSEAIVISERVFLPKSGKRLSEIESNRAVYGVISHRGTDGMPEEIDDGIAVVYRAPHSFTGEDTVEITCHGGVLVTGEVLGAVLAAGARPAEAGEFTRRAFIGGKMGLSAAEALGELLEADTHAKLVLSRSGLLGRVSDAAKELYDELCTVVSGLYAGIDYPEEDLSTLTRDEITEIVMSVLGRVRRLAATYRSGRAVTEGISAVICGKPNVGKSSLFNRLVGEETAIVTDIAGTTRDILEQRVAVGRVTLRLFDTAGLHESGDRVEKIGVDRAREKLREAELVLAVFDASVPLDEEDRRFCRSLSEQGGYKIAVLNKSDLPPVLDGAVLPAVFDRILPVSVSRGEGMDELTTAIESAFFDGSLNLAQDAIVANARQNAALEACGVALEHALAALSDGLGDDICASEIEGAMSALAGLDGREISEDIVNRIFSHFCVGK